MTVITKNKTKEVSIKELKKFLDKLLDEFGVKGKYTLPIKPDEEGDYYIIIQATNIKSYSKARKIEKSIDKTLKEKFGDNILISIIPT